MTTGDHPDDETLSRHVDDELGLENRSLVMDHLSSCTHCRHRVTAFGALSQALSITVPTGLVTKAVALVTAEMERTAAVRRPVAFSAHKVPWWLSWTYRGFAPPVLLAGTAASLFALLFVLESSRTHRVMQLHADQRVVLQVRRGASPDLLLVQGLIVLNLALPEKTPDDARFSVDIRDGSNRLLLSSREESPVVLGGRHHVQLVFDTRDVGGETVHLKVLQLYPRVEDPTVYDGDLRVRPAGGS